MHTPDDPTPTAKRRKTYQNNQCDPDMQCSNTWAMDTSHDRKSNTKSIIIIIYIRIKNKLGAIRFGRRSGFSTVT